MYNVSNIYKYAFFLTLRYLSLIFIIIIAFTLVQIIVNFMIIKMNMKICN